ncbi:MAG: transglutaminase domain-containing protein [Armatimonadetes bacterium]|nr:transglutaminase domain-containing protein [Armatimonadota bacterium]
MSIRFRRFVLALSVLLFSGAVSVSARPAELPREMWFGMYLGETKLGYTVLRTEKAGFEGAPALKSDSTVHTESVMMGAKMIQNIRTTVYTALSSSRPLYEEFRMSSGGKTTEVFARFEDDVVEARMVTGTGETKKSIPIPPGVKLVGDAYNPVEGETVKPGASFTQYSFNPLTLSIDKMNIRVERIQKMTLDGKEVDAAVVVTKSAMADLTTYQTLDGAEVIRIDAPMGIEMRRETQQEATSSVSSGYTPPKDLAVATSVSAGRHLASGAFRELRVTLSGVPQRSFVISDSRQRVEKIKSDDTLTVTYFITAEDYSEAQSGTLPVPATGRFQKYLSSEPYVEADSDAIKSQSRRIAGERRNIYDAACRIRRWIYEEMTPQANMGILRPATDVLKNRAGVCRDYAILFAALARAAGIPTRIVNGLILSRGRFYYHSWDEVWTGNTWLAFDSTLPTDRVDASHIKLTEGDATDMFRMGKVIGQLDAQILDYKY